jgi:chondroitin 4-sulfotransferase 11
MPINHDKKIIFIHIPKTGGTSLSNGLFNNSVRYNAKNLLGTMINVNGKWRRSSHCTAEEIDIMVPNIFKFYKTITIVRNPFDRMLSEYYHLVRYKIQHPILGKVSNLEFNQFVSKVYYNFDLIQKRQNYPQEDYFIHFLPQSTFLKINNTFINDIKIYRFEKFEEIEKDFNLVEKKNVNILRQKKSYHFFYNSTSKKMIKDIYSEDLETFNYFFGE